MPIVPISQNVTACSVLATFHQPRQRRGGDRVVRLDRAEAAEAADEVAPRVARGAEHDGEREPDDDRDDDHGLEPLDGLVDDGGGRQRDPDRDEAEDADELDVEVADHERQAGGGAGGEARPHVRDDGHDDEQRPPRLPQPREAGDRRLAGGQRVALDLHVDEELDRDRDDRGPQDRQADVRGDERPQHVLAGAERGGEQDHARPEHLAQRQGLRQVLDRNRPQYLARDVA
jgi:hypothetical protein